MVDEVARRLRRRTDRMTIRALLSVVAAAAALCGCSSARNETSAAAAKPAPRLILVSGVTGRQGGAVARQLLAKGYRVRGLTRNPESDHAKTAASWGVELVKGDFEDRASLARALQGCDGAFSVQDFWEHGREGEVREGKAFADEAKAAGIRHFVYSSVGSANRKTGIPHFESKWEVEEHVRAIGLPHTILRPVSFMENWNYSREQIEGGTLASPLSPDTHLQQIAVEVERAMGKPVRYERVPWDAFRAQSGEEITAMYRWFEAGGYTADVPALRKEFPFLTSFPAFVDGWAGRTAVATR
jgi:hypothetical protein